MLAVAVAVVVMRIAAAVAVLNSDVPRVAELPDGMVVG